MLQRTSEPVPIAALQIGPSADYVGLGSATIDLRTRGSLRRIVLALVDQRRRAPGASISAENVFEAGWPAERVNPRAAAARVYTAMYTLRRMGLRGILIRRDDGYLLDPNVDVDVAAPWSESTPPPAVQNAS